MVDGNGNIVLSQATAGEVQKYVDEYDQNIEGQKRASGSLFNAFKNVADKKEGWVGSMVAHNLWVKRFDTSDPWPASNWKR